MTRFMQLMLDGKPVAVPEDQYHLLALQARRRVANPDPEERPQPRPHEYDEPAAWRDE